MLPLKPIFPKTLKPKLRITIGFSLEWGLECLVVNIDNFPDEGYNFIFFRKKSKLILLFILVLYIQKNAY